MTVNPTTTGSFESDQMRIALDFREWQVEEVPMGLFQSSRQTCWHGIVRLNKHASKVSSFSASMITVTHETVKEVCNGG